MEKSDKEKLDDLCNTIRPLLKKSNGFILATDKEKEIEQKWHDLSKTSLKHKRFTYKSSSY